MAARGQVPDVTPAFPTNLTGAPGTLLYRQIGLNRVTNIAYHNGFIYTHEVGGGNPRRWLFTDINDPSTFTIQQTGAGVGPFSDHGTHGHFKVGDWLGGQFGMEIRRQSDGVNVLQAMPGFVYLNNEVLQPGDGISRMYYPWGTPFNWIQYEASVGNGFLYRGTEKLIEWPALAEHGVAGNSLLLGNLLFITSDESDMGILAYDISPVFETPAQPPVLLDKLSGALGSYIASPWEHYLVLGRRSGLVDIVDFSDPTNLQHVTTIDCSGDPAQDLNNGLGYIQCQDNFVFLDRHKIDMDTFAPVLEFDEVGTNRPVGSIGGQLDTSQRMLPVGNLLITGGYSISGADGVGVWLHDSSPDTNAPYVGYHVPRPGQTNFPLGAPISLLIHETLESYTIVNGESVILRPLGGDPVDAIVSFSYDDVLTITPDEYLLPDTTYEVEIVADGIKDVSGNGILPYTFTFSTGDGVAGGNASPVIASFDATPSPAEPGSEVTFSASATDADLDELEYRFVFGDGGMVRDWDTLASASHVYTDAGHYGVKVQVRDVRTGTPLSTVSQTGAITIAAEPPATMPTHSSPIALNETSRQLWVVNPDNNSVSIIDPDARTLVQEINLNVQLSLAGSIDPRNVAIDGVGNAWVTCRDANCVAVLSPAGSLAGAIFYDYGHTPMGVAITPDGATAYVTLEGSGELRRYDTVTRAETGSLALGPMPRALAITADGASVFVTRFISEESHGEIWEIDAAAMALADTINLQRDRTPDGASGGRGVPNYVSSITISPAGDYAYYTAVKANTQRGQYFNQGVGTNDPLDSDNTVRAIVGRINLSNNSEPFISTAQNYRVDIDNSDSPTSIVFSPRGDYFFVSLQGNNHFAVFDDLLVREFPRAPTAKTSKGRFATGLAPQGLVFDSVTNQIFSADFMGRSVTAHDLDGFLSFGSRATERLAISKVTSEALAPEVLLGKQIFYLADDASGLTSLPSMSLEGYISCASCHVDGSHDGRTWDFTQRGEGLRNTTDLRGRSGMGQGNVHWTGNFDEVQDFILDIVNEFGGGDGLLPEGESPNPSLGASNAGRSTELDALAAYVSSLGTETLPRSPYRNPYGTLRSAALRGQEVFNELNCASCHSGADRTDSTVGVATLHDVGTLRASSGQRLSAVLTGIDTPSLNGLWTTAPYLHDGSALTIDEVFRVAGGEIYQAEDAAHSGGAYLPGGPRINEDSSMHGQMVYVSSGQSVTFSNVDGGGGGLGDLELRWMISFYGTAGTVTANINGVDYDVSAQRPLGFESSMNHWFRLRIEDVDLAAGASNTITVTCTGNENGFDEMVVINADDRAAATHRSALALDEADYEALMQFLLQIDGSGNVQPANPTAVIMSVQGDQSMLPYAEFDIVFSEPVTGFEYEDLLITDNALSTMAGFYAIEEGVHYRLRLSGFTQDGAITVELPAHSANAIDDGLPNLVAELDELVHVMADDLALLSDEFDDPTSIANWQRNYQVEGWGDGANKLETWDIAVSREGHMRAMPYSSTWFQNWTGAYAFKEITGDFVVTMRLEVNRRNGLAGRPSSQFSLAGIMVRTPRDVSDAAPTPDPGPGVVLPWPAPAEGQPNHYTTDWERDTENYIFLSYGYTSPTFSTIDDTWSCEVKTTIDGASTLYGVQTGIPVNENEATLQIIRRGSTFLLLRRHGDGPWIIENRFVRNDMPDTLQVGLTTYTDWPTAGALEEFHHNRTVIDSAGNPDVVADVDYFRVHRPSPDITEDMLAAVNITGQWGNASPLAVTSLSGLLGDGSDYPSDGESYSVWLARHFTPEQLADPLVFDTPLEHRADDLPGLLGYLTTGEMIDQPLAPMTLSLIGGVPQIELHRNAMARGYRWVIEATDDLETWEILAESVNGQEPSGPGFISEESGPIRMVMLEDIVDWSSPRFYRLNVEPE